MTESGKKIIKEFINNPDYFNIDSKYWELVYAVKDLLNSYNRKEIIINTLLKENGELQKERKYYNKMYEETNNMFLQNDNHIPHID